MRNKLSLYLFLFILIFYGVNASWIDSDGDGIPDIQDNCKNNYNPNQADCNSNGIGDICDSINPNATELCDLKDNNCNGYPPDENNICDGVCSFDNCLCSDWGEANCNAAYYAGIVGYTPYRQCGWWSNYGVDETCNGKDDDCDGNVDEGGVCCGNGICDSGETCSSCSQDCGQCRTCIDSDGINIYVKGYANSYDHPFNPNLEWDYCSDSNVGAAKTSGQWVVEKTCMSDGRILNSYYECPYGCLEGACLTQQQTPDLELKAVYKGPYSGDYSFSISFCVNGPKSINDLKRENSQVTDLRFAITVTDRNGAKHTCEGMCSGLCEEIKNGQCNDFQWTMFDECTRIFDEVRWFEVMLDNNEVIAETNEGNNRFIYRENIGQICIDSDNGQDIFVKGQAIRSQGGTVGIMDDTCIDETSVWEVYCEGNNIKGIAINCPSNYKCTQGRCIVDTITTEPRCGDNKCNGEETCSTCPLDCRCTSYEQCINGVCQGYCGNSRKDYGETCSSCPTDVACSSTQECVNGICISKCGNGRLDPGETCSSCKADAGCASGLTCKNGVCVGCVKDSQCKSSISYSGEFICSPDHKRVLEKGVKIEGFCRNGECIQKEDDITKEVKDCGTKFCQDGQCGCLEGYETCPKTGKCEKQFALEENSKCGCDFQCESGYCSNSKCLNALDIAFSSTKSELKPGEEATITLSVSNNLNKEIQFSGTADIGTGSEMVEIISGDDCSGNQCKISGTLDEMGRTETTIVVKSNSNKPIPLSASVGYSVDNKELEVRKQEVINKGGLKEVTGNVVTNGVSSSSPLIGTIIVLVIVFIGVGILFIVYSLGRIHSSRKKKL